MWSPLSATWQTGDSEGPWWLCHPGDISAPGDVGTRLAEQAVHAALFLLQLEQGQHSEVGNKVQQVYSTSKTYTFSASGLIQHSVENYSPWQRGTVMT